MAPEVFNVEDNKDKNYTKAADVYSYAMIFFEVLTGKVPFEGVRQWKIFQIIKKGERPNLPSEAYCPEYLSAFIRRCWATEAKERPEFPDICQMLVYCNELILRDSLPSPLICIVENDAQKLSSFLGPKCCFEKVYSFMVFAAYNNGDHRPDRIVDGRMKLDWIQAQVKRVSILATGSINGEILTRHSSCSAMQPSTGTQRLCADLGSVSSMDLVQNTTIRRLLGIID
jgi:serine/threonine protein kinase